MAAGGTCGSENLHQETVRDPTRFSPHPHRRFTSNSLVHCSPARVFDGVIVHSLGVDRNGDSGSNTDHDTDPRAGSSSLLAAHILHAHSYPTVQDASRKEPNGSSYRKVSHSHRRGAESIPDHGKGEDGRQTREGDDEDSSFLQRRLERRQCGGLLESLPGPFPCYVSPDEEVCHAPNDASDIHDGGSRKDAEEHPSCKVHGGGGDNRGHCAQSSDEDVKERGHGWVPPL
mmetsp:Transcript_28332/g.91687  ORF Transcript_28332/g.91687 Transcript_28332/m.91687 type:complete len:230 (+) Transcript_28332:328-1017(+)